MLDAEDGCVSISEARGLFRKPRTVTELMLRRQIEMGTVIANRTDREHILVPIWQFRPEGGLLNDLSEILHVLRKITS